MTTYAIALGDLATGVEWVSQASGYISLGTNRQVYVYLRNADGSQGSEASVFSDTGLSVPMSQPLTAGAQSGALPGYVASGQSLLFVDVLTSDTAQAEALAAAATGSGMAVGNPVSGATDSSLLATDSSGDLVSGPLSSSVENVSSAYANAGSSSAFGDVQSSGASIDLCRPPYSCLPSITDCTTAIQDAIDYAVTAGFSVLDIYFSVPGTYLVDGSPTTGNVAGGTVPGGYTYNGQILLPGIAYASSLKVRIRGGVGPSYNGGANRVAGAPVVLSSNLNTAGASVFDAIPATNQTGFPSAAYPWTNASLELHDVVIDMPNNTASTAVNALVTTTFGCKGLVVQTADWNGTTLTGTQEAIILPMCNNSGSIHVGATIRGFSGGMRLTEHAYLDAVNIYYCNYAFSPGNGGHGCYFIGVDVECTPTVFYSPAGRPTGYGPGIAVFGRMDWECVNTAPVAFVNESTTCVSGDLRVNFTDPRGGQAVVVGVSEGNSFNLSALNIGNDAAMQSATPSQYWGAGWRDLHPQDNFLRTGTITTGAPGLAWPTLHPWWPVVGGFQVASQQLTSTNGTSRSEALIPCKGGGESREIQVAFNYASSGGHVKLEAHRVVGGSHDGNCIGLDANGTGAYLYVNGTQRATAASIFTAGAASTMALRVLLNGAGIPQFVAGYANGAKLFSYALSTAEQALLGPGTYSPFIADGLSLYEESSQITNFSVEPAGMDPAPGQIVSISAARTAYHYETTVCTSGTFTVTLPAPVPNIPNTVINTGTGMITITPPSGTLTNLSGSTGNITLAQGAKAVIESPDGTNFQQVG